MDLTIVDTTSNTTEQVSVPATVATGRLIGRLLELWQLPDVGPDGQALSYGFDRNHGGSPISVDETLAEAGVRDNDVLQLIATSARMHPGASRRIERPASLSAETPVGLIPPTAVRGAPRTANPPSSERRAEHGPRDAVLPRRGGRGLYRLALAAVALAAVGIGVLFATGALSGGSRASVKSTPAQVTGGSATVQTPPTPAGPTENERAHDRGVIMALLAGYQEDYSSHSLPALSGLFTSGITRHGLAAGGCRVSHGRSAVTASYQSQFDKGSGAYSLVGLSAAQIQLDTTTQAHLDTHYRITPGGAGYVDFKFADAGEGWKISEVYATCA